MAPEVLYRTIFGNSNPDPSITRHLGFIPARLRQFRRHRVKMAKFPAIFPSAASLVPGVCITGLTDGDLRALDRFETTMFKRMDVAFKVWKDMDLEDLFLGVSPIERDGHEVEGQTYVWAEGLTELEPAEWDFNDFRNKHIRAFLGEEFSQALQDEGFVAADVLRAAGDRGLSGGRGQPGGQNVPPGGNVTNSQRGTSGGQAGTSERSPASSHSTQRSRSPSSGRGKTSDRGSLSDPGAGGGRVGYGRPPLGRRAGTVRRGPAGPSGGGLGGTGGPFCNTVCFF